MPLPMLKEFLCGFPVRTGCLIVGWVFMVHSVLISLVVGTYSIQFLSLSEGKQVEVIQLLIDSFGNSNTLHDFTKEDYLNAILMVKLTIGVAITIAVISFLIDFFLLIGIYKKNHYAMFPCILSQALGCIFVFLIIGIWALILIVQIVHLFVGNMTMAQFAYVITITLTLLTNAAIVFYIYLLFYTYYRTIKKEKKEALLNYSKM